MKKVLLILAFLSITQITLAQDDIFKKDVLRLVEMCGSTASIKVSREQIIKMVPKEKQAAFLKEFDAAMPILLDKLAKVYMETYTKEDIKAMLEFYKTPVGKKMSEKAGDIARKSIAIDQEWVTEGLQAILEKFVQ